jgi:UrcA family protein
MSVTTFARAALAVSAGLCATAAFAAADPTVVITQHSRDVTAVKVRVSDLNLSTATDRDLLAIRIDNAARAVCDVNGGSRLDRLPNARTCLSDAHSSALAQLGVRGQTASAVLASAAALD